MKNAVAYTGSISDKSKGLSMSSPHKYRFSSESNIASPSPSHPAHRGLALNWNLCRGRRETEAWVTVAANQYMCSARAHTSTRSSGVHVSEGRVFGAPATRTPAARPPATKMTRANVASASTRASRAAMATTSPRAPENRHDVLAERTPSGRENFINQTDPPVSSASPLAPAHVTCNAPHSSPPSVTRRRTTPWELSYWQTRPRANPAKMRVPSLLYARHETAPRSAFASHTQRNTWSWKVNRFPWEVPTDIRPPVPALNDVAAPADVLSCNQYF